MFIASFKIMIHDTLDCDAARLTHLRSCLTPEIQRHLGEALINPGLYQFALTELQRKFGNPQIVAQACTKSLLALQSFKDRDYNALLYFASSVHSVVATLQQGGYESELYSSSTLFQIVSKLPPLLKEKWGEISWSMQPQLPSVLDFDWWLDNVSMAQYSIHEATSSSLDQQKTGQTPSSSSGNRPKPTSNPIVYHASSTICPNCGESHSIDACQPFNAMPVEKRADLVKSKRLCFRCLAKDHIGTDCSRSEICNHGGCRGLHHPL